MIRITMSVGLCIVVALLCPGCSRKANDGGVRPSPASCSPASEGSPTSAPSLIAAGSPVGGGVPLKETDVSAIRLLLARVNKAVADDDMRAFDSCHLLQGDDKELLEAQFRYLVAERQLREIAEATYGKNEADAIPGLHGGILMFDSSWFGGAEITGRDDMARAKSQPIDRGNGVYTYGVLLRKVKDQWFLAPEDEVKKTSRKTIRFVIHSTAALHELKEDVKSGRVKCHDLDDVISRRVEDAGKTKE